MNCPNESPMTSIGCDDRSLTPTKVNHFTELFSRFGPCRLPNAIVSGRERVPRSLLAAVADRDVNLGKKNLSRFEKEAGNDKPRSESQESIISTDLGAEGREVRVSKERIPSKLFLPNERLFIRVRIREDHWTTTQDISRDRLQR